MATGLDDSVMFGREGVGPNNQFQAEAVRNILGLGIGALSLGAGARGLSGLGSFLSHNLGGPVRTPMRQSFVRIPVPVKVHSREERDAMLEANEQNIDKEAGLDKLATLADWSKSIADTFGLLRRPGVEPNFLQKHLGGWGEQSMANMPWAVPTAAAVGVGGAYGGWKLTDYLLDKTKNIEQESELEQARQDYEKALAGRRKVASAGTATGPLDSLADLYEKRAGWLNPLLGAGLLGAGGLALGSGIGAYNWTRSLAEDKAVEEAVKRRQAQISEQAPSPVMAIPMPVPIYDEPRKSHWHQLAGHGRHLAEHGRRLLGYEPEKDKEKVANVGQAADQFLNRIKSNQMAVWQRLMTPPDAKPAKAVKPAEPAPPQLPTLAGMRTNMTGQQST